MREQIYKLAKTDPIINAILMIKEKTNSPYLEAIENMVIQLEQEKRKAVDEVIKLRKAEEVKVVTLTGFELLNAKTICLPDETSDQLEGNYAIRYANGKHIVTDLGCDESTYL